MLRSNHFVRVRAVQPLDGFQARFEFTNGEVRVIDLEPFMSADAPVFAPLRSNPQLFRQMRVEGGTVAWPTGADIDPDVLYAGRTPATWE